MSVPRLEDLCIDALASNIGLVTSLEGIPEELVCCLFQEVIRRGKLTPAVLRLFRDTQHDRLLEQIRAMGITDWIPPVHPTFGQSWLGDKPKYY